MSSKVRSSDVSYAEFASAVARRLLDRGLAERGFAVLRQPLSTHLLGRRIAREYSQESAWPPKADLLAWRQEAGQGRGGRSWSSPPGGVYATLIRPLTADVALQTLPLKVATTLCEALNDDLDGRCRLKWPNDLLVGGRKLGGILIDVASRGAAPDGSSSAEAPGLAVVSFGVNHRHPDQPGATSMEREAAGRTLLADLAVRLVEAVDGALEAGPPVADVVGRYRQFSLHRPGDALRCRLRGDEVEGVFQGFDRHGFLRLEVGGEERLLTAGEIIDHG